MAAFSGYQLSRFGVLSATGRIGTLIGLPLGLVGTFYCHNAFERLNPTPTPEPVAAIEE
jgi:hypothetical protein